MQDPTLPPGFTWRPADLGLRDSAALALVAGEFGTEVARVNPRVDGSTWLANVNRHRRTSLGYLGATGIHPNRGSALRMVARWAWAHQERLLREVAGRQVGLPAWGSTPLQGALEGPSIDPRGGPEP